MEKRIKVLISENGADFMQEYVPVLEEAGMTVVCTERDGRTLLGKIESEHPDVVLAGNRAFPGCGRKSHLSGRKVCCVVRTSTKRFPGTVGLQLLYQDHRV